MTASTVPTTGRNTGTSVVCFPSPVLLPVVGGANWAEPSAVRTSNHPNDVAGRAVIHMPAFPQQTGMDHQPRRSAPHFEGMTMKNDYEIRGDVTVIFLQERDGKRFETLIDTEDLPKLLAMPIRWYASYDSRCQNFYVRAYQPNASPRFPHLHRVITDAPKGMHVDHIEHNGLDNRRSMLRVVTNSQNQLNRRGAQRNSKSGIRGVRWHGKSRRWRAQIKLHRATYWLGDYINIEDAKAAYDRALERAQRGLSPAA